MSTVPDFCDVVVIGGGPAGSLAATYLTAKGYSVVLFEKEKHPRYQVGESLLPDVWKYCDAAGVSEAIAGEGFLRKAGGSVDWNGEMRRMSFGITSTNDASDSLQCSSRRSATVEPVSA